jgi:protein-tyrosine phosphatase
LVWRRDKEAPKAPGSSGVLFVCTGNICRSPTAEGVFRKLAQQAGLLDALLIDSAGTHDYHVGAAPDPRAQAAARRRGYDLSKLRARRIEREDFNRFDFILAMDQDHLRILNRLQPQDYAGHLGLLLEFAPQLAVRDVPDPYYGGPDAFDEVLDLVERASAGLLAELLARPKR